MSEFPLASVQIRDDEASLRLRHLLNQVAPSLEACVDEPTLVAEAPNKFNDAWYDDFWCAVQSGRTYWEQSQFFEDSSARATEERSSYTPEAVPDEIKKLGVTLTSQRIAALRSELRTLEVAGWRDIVEQTFSHPRNLVALMVDIGQKWLCLEQVNNDDCDVFAWDDAGFFHVGSMKRFDQAIGRPQIMQLEHVDPQNLGRLSPKAQRYFLPEVEDEAAVNRLAGLLRHAVDVVRDATPDPVAMKAKDSRPGPGDLARTAWYLPESYAVSLRPSEGVFRKAVNGVWPSYRNPRVPYEESKLSPLAKALNLALGSLEDAQWKREFEVGYGQSLARSDTLSLFVDEDAAVLMRDNSAFRLTDNGLSLLGVGDHARSYDPQGTLLFLEYQFGATPGWVGY